MRVPFSEGRGVRVGSPRKAGARGPNPPLGRENRGLGAVGESVVRDCLNEGVRDTERVVVLRQTCETGFPNQSFLKVGEVSITLYDGFVSVRHCVTAVLMLLRGKTVDTRLCRERH